MATNGMNTPVNDDDEDYACCCRKPGCQECWKYDRLQARRAVDAANSECEAESILSVNAADNDMENRINGG